MGNLYSSATLIVLGFIPSLVWLGYYLKKDPRPEPRYLISRVFFLGIVLAPLAIIAQWIFREFALDINSNFQITASVYFFLWAAFVEEIVKFLAVKFVVLHNPAFDEPVDAMIYMISAALGFAAIENILVLFQAIPNGAYAALQIWFLRFVGATLIHAVSSAFVGYFLAVAWFYHRHSGKLIWAGLGIATFLHFVFNIILLSTDGRPIGFLYTMVFLLITASIIAWLFNKIRKFAFLST